MAETILSVEHLSASYDGRKVLHDVSFKVEEGSVVAVLGPNGSGKTTLFRALLGLIPFQGQVRIKGAAVNKHLGRIGYVPQRFDFDKTIPMTVREFLKIAFSNVTPSKVQHVLGEVDMVQQADQPIGTLSGGQFQRVLIARALINEPFLLLLDEATSGIDVAGARGFYEIITHLNQVHQTTMLFISHEVNMVYEFANEIVCLNRDLVCFGKPKEALTKEVLEKLYGKEFRLREHEHS